MNAVVTGPAAHRLPAAAVVAAYGEAGLVHLTTALGLWENLHRFDNALALLAGTPEET